MKFKVVIIDDVEPQNDFIIVYFQSDKNKQHFQINCAFNPYNCKIRKWEVWELNIKFRSEIFEDTKTKVKSYFTHLDCDKFEPIHQMPRKH